MTGLTITAGSSTVRGLVINRFSGDGIAITGSGARTTWSWATSSAPMPRDTRPWATVSTASSACRRHDRWDNTVALTSSRETQQEGIFYQCLATRTWYWAISSAPTSRALRPWVMPLRHHPPTDPAGNTIRGNDISGNGISGHTVGSASPSAGATSNVVQGNFIGTDVTGPSSGQLRWGIVQDAASTRLAGRRPCPQCHLGQSAVGITIELNRDSQPAPGQLHRHRRQRHPALGNSGNGVNLLGPPTTRSAGRDRRGNVISGNGYDGIGYRAPRTTRSRATRSA